MISLRRGVRITVFTLVAALAVACSNDDSATDAPPGDVTTTTSPASTSVDPDSTPRDVLRILVSNDDGYDAEGIDKLVEGLFTIENVEITIYAPRDPRSATGGTRTDGDVEITDVTTASGRAAKAIDGYPSDAVRAALEVDGLEPHLVVSGINEGQNVGPIIDISGTIGAARVGVANGIPALAVSQGMGEVHDYDSAVTVVLDWIHDHADALRAGTADVEVVNVNVPSCDAGMIRGLVEVEPDPDAEPGLAVSVQDCTSTDPFTSDTRDVGAFSIGYATISVVPAEPTVPVTVVTTTTSVAAG